eukprot:5830353-Prymnesium_polylepis.1
MGHGGAPPSLRPRPAGPAAGAPGTVISLILHRPFFRCQTDPQLEWQQLYFTLSAQRKFFG